MPDDADNSRTDSLAATDLLSDAPTQRDLLRQVHRLPLPMPGTPRELFELLGLYEPAEGLDALLNRLNIAGITPQHIYRVVHRRPPESIERAFAPADYEPAQHLKAALLSSEFRENLLSGLLLAFPEKHREVFIHIPKCAGTDLILNLAPNRLTIPKVLEDTRWVSESEFFDALRGIIRAIPYYDTFFIYGHMVLGNYVELVRASAAEKIFTVLRDPFDMMLSQANYALTRLRRDPAGNDPDTREILDALEVPRLPDRPSLREIRELALRALRVPKIVLPNSTCFHLGTEDRPTYDAALRHIVIYDVEVSTTRRYKDWLRERWGIHSRTRHNLSDHWLTLDDIDDETAEVMREQSAEDRKLFNHLSRLIEESGKVSITGSEIALMIGAGSSDEHTVDPIADRASVQIQTHRREPRRGVATAMGRRAIEALIGVSGNPTPEFTVQFGTGGDLNEYEHAGWALPETGFTWTSAEAVQLTLSKPVREGDYLLRVTGAPFVVRDKLPDQRIIAIVNGIVLGEAAIRETAAIEYELPAAVLGGDEFMTLVFELPDAARPREMTGAEDDRLLAIAFSRIDLIHCDDLAEGAGPGVATTTVASEPRPRRTFVPKEASDAAPIDLSALMMGFESLGENCEFGLVQRRCGAEPLGLFRFASAPLPKLMAGLEARFEGMADPENLMVQLSDAGTEYMVEDQRFGFLYHAWVLAGEMIPEDIHAREVRRLPLLIRKLVEDLEHAEKIFVYHGMTPMTTEEAVALFALTRRYGPNALLWVELADDDHEPGMVEWAAPGLLKGYIDRLAPEENAHDLSLDCWIAICREAASMRRAAMKSATTLELHEPEEHAPAQAAIEAEMRGTPSRRRTSQSRAVKPAATDGAELINHGVVSDV